MSLGSERFNMPTYRIYIQAAQVDWHDIYICHANLPEVYQGCIYTSLVNFRCVSEAMGVKMHQLR